MKNNNGMTLIEVIIALFLLGLITVVFLPSTWSSYKMMANAKEITADTFTAQKKVELAIEEARDKMVDFKKDNSNPNPINMDIKAFGKTIKGVSIVESILNEKGNSMGNINVFVADEPLINDNLPELEWVKVVDKNVKEGIIKWEGNKLTGSHKIKDTSNYFMSLKRWYVSKSGFDGYMPDRVENESYWGTRYPSWPNDYELINNNDKTELSDLSPYAGRHVVFSVIPVAKTGKYGIEVKSKEIYIMGPPIINNLLLHLDTYSLNNPDDSRIEKWKDLYDNKETKKSSGDGAVLGYDNGKFLSFHNDLLTMDGKPANTDNMTIFVVFKNTSDDENKTQNLINRNTTQNGWKLHIRDGKIEFLINPSANNQADRVITSDNKVDKDKYIITARVTNNDIKMILDKDDNNETKTLQRGQNSSYANSAQISIGDTSSEENIYEIIIYNSALSDEEINKIRQYLAEKHRINLNL